VLSQKDRDSTLHGTLRTGYEISPAISLSPRSKSAPRLDLRVIQAAFERVIDPARRAAPASNSTWARKLTGESRPLAPRSDR